MSVRFATRPESDERRQLPVFISASVVAHLLVFAGLGLGTLSLTTVVDNGAISNGLISNPQNTPVTPQLKIALLDSPPSKPDDSDNLPLPANPHPAPTEAVPETVTTPAEITPAPVTDRIVTAQTQVLLSASPSPAEIAAHRETSQSIPDKPEVALLPTRPKHMPSQAPQMNRAQLEQTTQQHISDSRPTPVAGHTPVDVAAVPTAVTATDTRLQEPAAALIVQVQHLLASRLSYPTRARRKGWEGRVLIGFQIDPEGTLNNVHLARSSGYSLLDNSAMKAMGKLPRVVMPARMLDTGARNLQVPVIFRLHDS